MNLDQVLRVYRQFNKPCYEKLKTKQLQEQIKKVAAFLEQLYSKIPQIFTEIVVIEYKQKRYINRMYILGKMKSDVGNMIRINRI